MLISELYNRGTPVISFEVFPPKKDADVESIYSSLDQMAELSPDFISVTCGAGGAGNRNMTAEIASFIENKHSIPALAHLTCIGAEVDKMHHDLDDLKKQGVHNLLALRGDLVDETQKSRSYLYASDLIKDVRSYGGFCVGAACYPEGHIDCDDLALDTEHLLQKQAAGAQFLITQLFFDNDYFFRFLERARSAGVTIPISAGVMPILGRAQIERMIFMCGASLPSGIIKLLKKYQSSPADLRKAGIEYAAAQIDGLLAHGADGIHIYTMNKPDIAKLCTARIGRG